VFIDGPPFWTRRGREACLYQVALFLTIGGRIYLDDSNRPDEQAIIRNWLNVYPGIFGVRYLESNHGICVLTKVQDVAHPGTSYPVLLDNIQQNAILTAKYVLSGFRSPGI
jgi:hypothetical protein